MRAIVRRVAAVSIFVFASDNASAIETTQTLNLASGWNAVWLEVDPIHLTGDRAGTGRAVGSVFTNPAIEVVAAPRNPHGGAEFVTDSGTDFFNHSKWEVWYRTSELGSSSLGVVRGHRAYLIRCSSAVTQTVTGTASYREIDWEPFSYNLVGFGLHTPATFGAFFAGSPQHPVNRIFRLNPTGGSWESVRPTDAMESGRAYWVYCDGAEGFNGAVGVDFRGEGRLDFGEGPAAIPITDPQNNGQSIRVSGREVIFTNPSSTAQTVTLRKVLPATGGNSINDALRVFDLAPKPGTLTFESGLGLINGTSYPVAATSTTVATLGANRNWTSGAARRENLYRIEFAHHYRWLPAAAENPDLSDAVLGSANPAAAGLWVGEVVVDKVSSITEAGRPLRPTTSTAPLRVILHVDATGKAHLLSHAMFMQTKTADPTVAPGQVIVLNEAKIPFYEGVEERAGKRVGVRIESVGYDMPRVVDRTAQAALLAAVATFANKTEAQVTDADIASYIAGLAARAPKLAESYHLKWPLEGSPGSDAVVRTGARPLTMDAFHRSNPFRHAFHPRHGTGKNLSRSITLSFDGEASPDRLSGTYTEIMTGLAAFPITTSGNITLQRISTTASLVE